MGLLIAKWTKSLVQSSRCCCLFCSAQFCPILNLRKKIMYTVPYLKYQMKIFPEPYHSYEAVTISLSSDTNNNTNIKDTT